MAARDGRGPARRYLFLGVPRQRRLAFARGPRRYGPDGHHLPRRARGQRRRHRGPRRKLPPRQQRDPDDKRRYAPGRTGRQRRDKLPAQRPGVRRVVDKVRILHRRRLHLARGHRRDDHEDRPDALYGRRHLGFQGRLSRYRPRRRPLPRYAFRQRRGHIRRNGRLPPR